MVRLRFALVLSIAVLALMSLAVAGPVQITIENGSPSGFLFSVIHTADSSVGAGQPDFFNSGSILVRSMQGTLDGNLTTVSGFLQLTFSGNITLHNSGGTQIGTMMITSGTISDTASGFAEGTIDFSVDFDAGLGTDFAGTWYFYARDFGLPNVLSATGFHLWGNNWDNLGDFGGPTKATVDPDRGIDLKASIQAVPEGPALAYLGMGLLALAFLRKYL